MTKVKPVPATVAQVAGRLWAVPCSLQVVADTFSWRWLQRCYEAPVSHTLPHLFQVTCQTC